jgi:hypothetical protein
VLCNVQIENVYPLPVPLLGVTQYQVSSPASLQVLVTHCYNQDKVGSIEYDGSSPLLTVIFHPLRWKRSLLPEEMSLRL